MQTAYAFFFFSFFDSVFLIDPTYPVLFKLISEREEGREKREKHRFVVPLIDAFLGGCLYVP